MYSKTTLIGNLGRDPELRYTPNGNAVCNFSVATNDRFNDKTEWHRIVVWGKIAEACNQHLSKGRRVCVEGKLQYRKWEDREGVTRQATEIVANQVIFLSGGANTAKQNNQTEMHFVPELEVSEDAPNALNVSDDDTPF
jgi:single-strand DNA-binding protein